jgi:hypothetical protein
MTTSQRKKCDFGHILYRHLCRALVHLMKSSIFYLSRSGTPRSNPKIDCQVSTSKKRFFKGKCVIKLKLVFEIDFICAKVTFPQ